MCRHECSYHWCHTGSPILPTENLRRWTHYRVLHLKKVPRFAAPHISPLWKPQTHICLCGACKLVLTRREKKAHHPLYSSQLKLLSIFLTTLHMFQVAPAHKPRDWRCLTNSLSSALNWIWQGHCEYFSFYSRREHQNLRWHELFILVQIFCASIE